MHTQFPPGSHTVQFAKEYRAEQVHAARRAQLVVSQSGGARRSAQRIRHLTDAVVTRLHLRHQLSPCSSSPSPIGPAESSDEAAGACYAHDVGGGALRPR
jgi:hypothetical protein